MPARAPRLSPSAAQGELTAALAELRRELEVPDAFPADVLAEAERVGRDGAVDDSDADRADLRDIEFCTIDPEGSRDLDQALHIARDGDGFTVHYAIADLAAVVHPGGDIDTEARRRGQTLYLPDGVVPLHPEVLSHGAASLLADEDRRAYVWRFELDAAGMPAAPNAPRRAWVRSRRQWNYLEAQTALDAGTAPESIALLAEVGPALLSQEAARGGASLNSPEAEIVAGPTGYRIEQRAALPIEDWNAQISLMTGMAAARLMLERGVGILRTLPPAEEDAIAEFRRRVALIDHPWPEDVAYGDYLRAVDVSDPAAPAIMQAASALFRGADYIAFTGEQPEQPLQAAIGAPYAHATAPLRRLVDRFVLSLCTGEAQWGPEELEEVVRAMRSSGQLAGRLESGVLDRVEAAVLHSRIGETFDAVVVAETKSGARVQLADPFVTAAVSDPAAPGTALRVRVESTDITAGEVALDVES